MSTTMTHDGCDRIHDAAMLVAIIHHHPSIHPYITVSERRMRSLQSRTWFSSSRRRLSPWLSFLLPLLLLPRVGAFSSPGKLPQSLVRLEATTTTTASQETGSMTIDSQYYAPPEPSSMIPYGSARVTLSRFLSNQVKEHPEYQDLQNILLALELSCKTIANLVNRAGLVYSIQNDLETEDGSNASTTTDDYSDGRYYSMKRLDKLSTNVLKNALKFTGTVQMIAPAAQVDSEQPQQHQPGVLVAYDENFVACLDPLDGSGNADASICTGTVFGVFARATTSSSKDVNDQSDLLQAVLQPARNMRAAGYCLYSSATVLVFTLANGVYGFTLDPQIQEFVLTHDNLTIPPRGNVYSCNEANSEGWNDPWKTYLKNLKLGQGETKQRYAHRYVGSMVGDIHRTLLYGGIFAYPSDKMEKPQGNLQLLYKSAPMAFVVHHAGGKAMDEQGRNLLDMRPERIHQKSPCFMGSPDDLKELEGYLKNESDESSSSGASSEP